MKVIVICASPRKNGNSEILADQFIKGAQFSGHDCRKDKYSISIHQTLLSM